MENKICLRMDDVGASTKIYEQYSKYPFCNLFFLKRIKKLKAWGIYQEMTLSHWEKVFDLLIEHNAILNIAITATWVEYSGKLIPFYEKFPIQAKFLKSILKTKHINILNHGLTHCITEKKQFRPKLIRSNRKYHREFYDWVPYEKQLSNLKQSKTILENYFETKIDTLVPPGNVYSDATLEIANNLGFKYINCNTNPNFKKNIKILDNKNVFAFHDKEIVELGLDWFGNILNNYKNYEFLTIKDLYQSNQNDIS